VVDGTGSAKIGLGPMMLAVNV